MGAFRLLAGVAVVVALATVLAVEHACAVDRSNFKTCTQSGFCSRHRAIDRAVSPYSLDAGTITVRGGVFYASVLNENTQKTLELSVSVVKAGAVRVKLVELGGLHARYEVPVGDALVEEPQVCHLTTGPNDHADGAPAGSVLRAAEHPGLAVVVTHSPLRVDVLDGDEVVMSFNGRSKLHFETHVARGDPWLELDVPQEGLWEESFKSHKDSKPRGPNSVGADVSFLGFEHLYGIPEHATKMALAPTRGAGISSDPYRLFNLDVFEYELNNPMALYGSIPVMVAHSAKRSVGAFWLNAAETWVDVSNSRTDQNALGRLWSMVSSADAPQADTHWMSESGVIDLFLMIGPTPGQVFAQYAALTGTTALPPLFAIAYHQCRWNYRDEADVAAVNAGFDEHDIPMDVLWLDIEHTDGKRYFTWDPRNFPTPASMQQAVASKGRRMVTIVDPHIKRDNGFAVHSEATELRYYVRKADGETDFDGWCWPGSSSYLDFSAPAVRSWWADRFALDAYAGSTLDLFTWNDMNEPSVFNGPEVSMPRDNVHAVGGGWEHRDVHNVYGAYFHAATAEGLRRRSGYRERPFVLSRAFFAGSQRHGAVWTGDNMAQWDHLAIGLPMLLTLGIAGLPFAGADVGGFFGNPDAELMVRWYQAGAFQPFFRGHAHLDSKRREPWLFDPDTTRRIRAAIRARYAHLPLWYALFRQASRTGMPVMRPMWVEFPADETTFAMDDQYMVGSALLVKPVVERGATSVSVYLAGGPSFVWFETATGKRHAGGSRLHVPVDLDAVPVFQAGGSIVPMKWRVRRSSSLMAADPYTLVVALDADGAARGHLYADDGHSTQFEGDEQAFVEAELSAYTGGGGGVTLSSTVTGGRGFPGAADIGIERIVVWGVRTEPTAVLVKGGAAAADGASLKAPFSHDAAAEKLTIKKPAISIGDAWTVSW